jgi:hypothetical protein
LTRFLKSFWILYIDQIIVYNAFYSKLTFYIIKDRCQMHALNVFRSPVWLLLRKLSSPHYRYIRKMWRGDRLPLTQVLFQNCVRQSRSPTKMTTTVQLRCYWKQLWSRWAITGSWEPLVTKGNNSNILNVLTWCTLIVKPFTITWLSAAFILHKRKSYRPAADLGCVCFVMVLPNGQILCNHMTFIQTCLYETTCAILSFLH